MLCQARSIDPGNERDLERKTRPENPRRYFHTVPTVQGAVQVGREDGEQERDKRPARRAPEAREENGDSAQDFRRSTDDIHHARERDVGRNHLHVSMRMKEMVHARNDEARREQN